MLPVFLTISLCPFSVPFTVFGLLPASFVPFSLESLNPLVSLESLNPLVSLESVSPLTGSLSLLSLSFICLLVLGPVSLSSVVAVSHFCFLAFLAFCKTMNILIQRISKKNFLQIYSALNTSLY